MRIVSLQSGTSADGIDVAIVDIVADDETRTPAITLRTVHCETLPLAEDLRERVLAFTHGAAATAFESCVLDTELGQVFAGAATAVERAVGLDGIDLVVSHGQTVYHWVDDSGTARGSLQLGEPSWVAESFGAPVLAQLRTPDIAAGGAGAPLMSVLDRLWLGGSARASGRAQATLNLGGIANLQAVSPDGSTIGFDTGPANGLVDALVSERTGGESHFDRDGELARRGEVHDGLLTALLAHPYLALAAPKTTGRETFNLDTVTAALATLGTPPTEFADLVATLTMFTARTVADAVFGLPERPERLIVSGGGVRNPVLIAMITGCLAPVGIAVVTSDELGIPAEFKESLMFALIGYLSWNGIPTALSSTPVGRAAILGHLVPGRMPLRLPEPLDGVSAVRLVP